MKLIKVPFSAGCLGKNLGSNKAPDGLVKEFLKKFKAEIEEIPVNQSNIVETNESISSKTSALSEFAVILGGDHSITYSCVKGFAKSSQNVFLLVFDAHPDCENDFSPPTHEDYLRALVDEKIVKQENMLLVGVRKIDELELGYLEEKKIRYITRKEIAEREISEVSEEILKKLKGFENVYLSLDIDVIDPKFAPGTGYIEPEGLAPEEFFFLLEKIIKSGRIKMADLVEINPEKDKYNKTMKLGVRILELLNH